MRTFFAALAVPAALAGLAPAPAAVAAATTLTIDNVVITPSGGGSQTIHIAGDGSQPISFSFTGQAPPGFYASPGYGGAVVHRGPDVDCDWSGEPYTCTGTGDLTIVYAGDPRTPVDKHGAQFTITATTPDGGSDSGLLTLRFKSDLEVFRPGTWYQGPGTYDSTTKFVAAVHNLGPDVMRNPRLRIVGLDTSLGLDAGCTAGGGAVVCALDGGAIQAHFTVPVCSAFTPVTVTVSTDTDDPNSSNNTYVVPGLTQVSGVAAKCPNAPRPGTGGGGSGGGTPPVNAPSPSSASPAMPSASASSTIGGTSTSTTRGGAGTVAHTDETDFPVWGVLVAGVIVACGVVGALLGLRFGGRRRVRTNVGEAGE